MTARTDPANPGTPAPGYAGPAAVVIDGAEYPVTVELRGTVQPIDGIFRWYGRVAPCPELDAAIGGGNRPGRLRTPAGEADATIGDRDFWDRYRVTGRGRPPFETPFDRARSDPVPRATG
ncbi:DUF4873 domain-containing protein [Aldersonia sp. NBC_00410]|uniref:DUF4873 domain-containing protein n=1 Tax=Aldersonia sp. NBC_00410 TaxID=2975954 RepID=UPI002250C1F6|nr:DUF4873 domain-containing protein [Aldersonia sp. NBC_00410]MCX5041854.1 DUF4873 domain-containing protein [Aldersonia sp. NBC_00410]